MRFFPCKTSFSINLLSSGSGVRIPNESPPRRRSLRTAQKKQSLRAAAFSSTVLRVSSFSPPKLASAGSPLCDPSARLRNGKRLMRLPFFRLCSGSPPFPHRTRCAGLRWGPRFVSMSVPDIMIHACKSVDKLWRVKYNKYIQNRRKPLGPTQRTATLLCYILEKSAVLIYPMSKKRIECMVENQYLASPCDFFLLMLMNGQVKITPQKKEAEYEST